MLENQTGELLIEALEEIKCQLEIIHSVHYQKISTDLESLEAKFEKIIMGHKKFQRRAKTDMKKLKEKVKKLEHSKRFAYVGYVALVTLFGIYVTRLFRNE